MVASAAARPIRPGGVGLASRSPTGVEEILEVHGSAVQVESAASAFWYAGLARQRSA